MRHGDYCTGMLNKWIPKTPLTVPRAASNDAESLVDSLLSIMQRAGDAILHHYASVASVEVHTKADHTPLTAADIASHEVVAEGLRQLTPDIPVLSEEAAIPPLSARQHWPSLWLVDPLDGTREFIDANDQFCINIALIEDGRATMGMIHAPVQQKTYLGIIGQGAWRIEGSKRTAISCREMQQSPILISSSRRFTPDMLACEDGIRQHFGAVERLSQGSAMKFCRVAEGEADIYPCFGPTSEWDTAAGQAIVEAAGGSMTGLDFTPFLYNRRATTLNGGFFLLADSEFDWQPILRAATTT